MSFIKRRLEDLTEELLDSVRATGSALLVERLPITEPTAHARTLRAVLELGTVWLCRADTEELDRLGSELAAWHPCPAPPDLAAEYLDALEQAVDETVGYLWDWLEPWGLCLEWTEAGLIARRLEESL